MSVVGSYMKLDSCVYQAKKGVMEAEDIDRIIRIQIVVMFEIRKRSRVLLSKLFSSFLPVTFNWRIAGGLAPYERGCHRA
jgi:hypothetical protein